MTTKTVRIAAAVDRAQVLQELHNYVIEYGIQHKMTCEELATVMVGLILRTSTNPRDLGSALGSIAAKLVDFAITQGHLAQLTPKGNA